VEFTLGTTASPTIEKNAIVRGVKGDYMGCEFFKDDMNDPRIGFYVL
jgi:hypothetical protein